MRIALTLEQLRIFAAVAERQHVTQAAKELNLTQSAVSAAVAALEGRYQVKLFDRIGRSIQLTEAGREFLAEARAVLLRAGDAETVLADLAGLRRGSLKLAASQTVAGYWLPPLMHRYRQAHPGISLSLAIGNTSSVAEMVLAAEAAIGFVEGEVDPAGLSVTPIADDELVLVAPPGLAAGSRAPLTAEDLRSLPFVLREEGSGTRAILDKALAGLGLTPADLDVALVLPSNEAVRIAVAAGAGVAALSKLVVRPLLKNGTLATLDFPLPKRRFFALRHAERTMTKAETAFYALLESEAAAPSPSPL